MYVLGGRLRLLLGGHEMVLTPGEVAEFDTRTPHAFTNPAPTPAELLILMSAQGQRAHVRVRSSGVHLDDPAGRDRRRHHRRDAQQLLPLRTRCARSSRTRHDCPFASRSRTGTHLMRGRHAPELLAHGGRA